MNFHKIISTILHPIVIPTIGVMVYFLIVPVHFLSNQKFAVLSSVFIFTYLVPLVVLIILKQFKIIKTYKTESISERKLPIILMIILYYSLGVNMAKAGNLNDLSLLFYATAIGLLFIYVLFYLKIKASIHLLSLGITVSFFLVLGNNYSRFYLLFILVTLLLAGFLGSARLYLKAHTHREVYIGFFLGFILPIVVNLVLK